MRERAESVNRLFEEARLQQTDQLAPRHFHRAEASLEAAGAVLAFEQDKLSLLRDFEEVNRLLRKSEIKLQRAFREARKRKERLTEEVDSDQLDVQLSLEQA